MLSSLSLGSIDNLEKLPINSLNNICDQVRQALLHVFLPRLCEKCQPAFSEVFRKTQSTPILLKALCEPCKISYIKDKRSVSRKKPRVVSGNDQTAEEIMDSLSSSVSENSFALSTTSTKIPAKKKKAEPSRILDSTTNFASSFSTHNLGNLTVKIKLIRTSSTALENVRTATSLTPFVMPLTPPPTELEDVHKYVDDDLTVLIDNSSTETISHLIPRSESVYTTQIYEYLSEKGIDWCRYCGVAGDTGTFWKLGPWGDRTLCHKHGCEFFGCGFARVTKTRLDLTKFYREKRSDRLRPIVSEFCSICWNQDENIQSDDSLINCNGCPLAFHQACLTASSKNLVPFYCSEGCSCNFEKCLIRPQFHSKTSFPYYRQLLTLPVAAAAAEELENEEKVQEVVIQPACPVIVPHQKQQKLKVKLSLHHKKRKYSHRKFNEHQVDRIVPFVPIKVDQTIHQHENINTPRWTVKSFEERQNYTSESTLESEDLDEERLLKRHARYEHVEKTTRLLKPGVLKQLISEQLDM